MLFKPASPGSPFSFDLRALAIFRMGLGVVVLLELLDRVRYLGDHYTEAGVIPMAALREYEPAGYNWTFHHLMPGGENGVLFLFVLQALFALALVFGFRTRLAAFGTWCLLASLQSRNPLLHIAGDDLERILLLWVVVLPCAGVWSLDSRGKKKVPQANSMFAGLGFVVQLSVFYLMAGWLKNGPEWQDLSTIYFVTNTDSMVNGLSFWLRHHPGLCMVLTFGVLWLERLGPLGFWLPQRFTRLRLLTLLSFTILQAGMWSAMLLGHFPLISTVALLPLLPGFVMDRLEKRLSLSPVPTEIARPGFTQKLGLALSAWLLLFSLAWTGIAFDWIPHRKLPAIFYRASSVLRLHQHFGVFAPSPQADDGWWIQIAHTGTISRFDAITGQPLSYEQPERIDRMYGGLRWQQYYQELWRHKGPLLPHHANWVCRRMKNLGLNREPVERISLVFMYKPVQPPGEPPVLKEVLVYEGPCP